MNNARSRLALIAALLLAASLGACSLGGGGGSITLLGPWTAGGAEAQVFQQVLDRFTAKTGIRVDYQGTRALTQVLTAEVQNGTPPDVAVLPNLGELANYVRRDAVIPLDDVVDSRPDQSHSPQWLQLERVEKGGQRARYAVAVKADLKSLIWYDPRRVPELRADAAPTWDRLAQLTKSLSGRGVPPWCMGMGSTPVSGWPGTDWIEDILLHQAGTAAYQQWSAGKLAWTSPEIRRAWATWSQVAVGPGLVRGGPTGVLLTDFGDAGRPMFADQPGCFLHHQASFLVGAFAGYGGNGGPPKLGTDVDFVPFPAGGTAADHQVWEVSADLAGMFNDKPAARELMRFLATDEAQSVWPAASHGAVFSVNRNVDPKIYDNAVSRRIAQTLTGPATLCFDASDLMPTAMTNAFYRAALEYLHAPDQLDRILGQLDQVRVAVAPTDWLNTPCG